MTTIVEALKSDHAPHLRVTTGDKWLVWSDGGQCWIVYYRGYYQRHTQTLVETPDEAEAVRYLLAEEP